MEAADGGICVASRVTVTGDTKGGFDPPHTHTHTQHSKGDAGVGRGTQNLTTDYSEKARERRSGGGRARDKP